MGLSRSLPTNPPNFPDSVTLTRVSRAAWKGPFLLSVLLVVGAFVGFSLCTPKRPLTALFSPISSPARRVASSPHTHTLVF